MRIPLFFKGIVACIFFVLLAPGAFSRAFADDPIIVTDIIEISTNTVLTADYVVSPDATYNACFSIVANNITLNGNGHTITGNRQMMVPYTISSGVLVEDRTGVTVRNCVFSDFVTGVNVHGSTSCLIENNTAHHNLYNGFRISDYSRYNTFRRNTSCQNIENGFALYGSYNNTFSYNLVYDNSQDPGPRTWHGFRLPGTHSNTLINNIIFGHVEASGIYLINTDYCQINNNILYNNLEGIWLDVSNYNTLSGNFAYLNSDAGFYFSGCFVNTVKDNIITDNELFGLYLLNCNNNTVYNNFLRNPDNVFDNSGTANIWSTSPVAAENIAGGPYLGGNYWSDYGGEDTDGDGLGDTLLPYANGITTGGDSLPLISYGSVSGMVTFEYPGISQGLIDVMYQVKDPGISPSRPFFSGNLTVSLVPGNPASGEFTISGLPVGTYDIVLKHENHIADLAPGLIIDGSDVTGLELTLWAGDCDGNNNSDQVEPGDNDVDFYDYYVLYYQHIESIPIITGEGSDFDGDGNVDFYDFYGLYYGYLNNPDPGNWYF